MKSENKKKHSRLQRLSLLVGVAAVLSACSMAPKYERPAAPVATTFPAVAAGSAQAQVSADTGWREFFPDQRLQNLIAAALEHNRDLRIAALRIEEVRAQYRIQSTELVPGVGVGATGQRGRTPADLSPTGAAVTSSSYQVGLAMSAFELDFFGRVRSLTDAALAQYLATEEAQRAAHISIVAEVAKAYLAERAFAEQLVLAQRTLASREEGLKLSRQRFEAGATSALDMRLNETLYHTARVAAAAAQRQRAQAENALTLLVGQPLQNLSEPQPLSSFNIVTDIPPGLPSDLLVRRPDIRAAEQQLLAANANIGAARAAFFPNISLTASLGTASSSLSGLFEGGSGVWSFAPQLIVPIFDAGRLRANLDIAEARKNSAVAQYERNIQQAFREVADALVARETLEEQIIAQQGVLEAQEARLQLAEQRYEAGVSSSLELLDAQREAFQAEQALVQARVARLTNAVDLYRALGGGLNEVTPPPSAEKKN